MPKKLTPEQVIARARKVHGDRYTYFPETISHTGAKMKVECPEHGEFWQQASSHYLGKGCPECGVIKRANSKRVPPDEIIKRSRKVHGEKYKYDPVTINGTHQKMRILCPEHGEFWQMAANHIQGKGCFKCGVQTTANERRISTAKLINRARKVHGNKYEYDLSTVDGTKQKMRIICPKHGEFLQEVGSHLQGHGCFSCGVEANIARNSLSINEIIKRSRETHGDRYEYIEDSIKSVTQKMVIVCKTHGEFYQTPTAHFQGKGCQECGKIQCATSRRLPTNEIIDRCKEAHGDTYDYHPETIKGANTHMTITCKIHGKFQQTPDNHFRGHGCTKCSSTGPSKQEDEVADFITKLGITTTRSDRKTLEGKELDIVIPGLKIAVEYCGIYWHTTRFDRMTSAYHYDKMIACEKAGYRLITIFSDEWEQRNRQVKGFLRSVLGKNKTRIGARKCSVHHITSKVATEFITENHIQPLKYVPKGRAIGLFHGDKLVGVTTFARHHRQGHKNQIVLQRMCFVAGTTVYGGASKMFKFAKVHIAPDIEIVSWSDSRWSQGKVYEKLGFTLDTQYKWDYSYVSTNGFERLAKQSHQKKHIGCPPERTEEEFCRNELGLYRIYDCGKKKWVYKT